MPVTRSAEKKLRQDHKRRKVNLSVKNQIKLITGKYKKSPNTSLLAKVYKILDTAAKKNTHHANKTARLKSQYAKMLITKSSVKPLSSSKKTSKKTSKPHNSSKSATE
ncbi:30S ribosomal protein S20 [Candidatus Gottesmanbacteria bacterium]|nr:30S ribosomal protein S20 [Candidatus Gottesmanbacteria bacterium]